MQFVAKKIQIRGREKMTNEFWRGKRVLVTGGAGFLGKYVVRSFACAQERERGAAEIIPSALLRACLRDISAIRQLRHSRMVG